MFASSPPVAHSTIYPSLGPLVIDVAPYVRAVLRTDIKREQERRRLSTLLSQGGSAKRRRTRAARTALEGGDRNRRERWFPGLGPDILNKTAGADWDRAMEGGDGSVGANSASTTVTT